MNNYLNIEQKYNSVDFTFDDRGELGISIDSPWEGDSESGFGAHLNVYLTKEEAAKLKEFLNQLPI